MRRGREIDLRKSKEKKKDQWAKDESEIKNERNNYYVKRSLKYGQYVKCECKINCMFMFSIKFWQHVMYWIKYGQYVYVLNQLWIVCYVLFESPHNKAAYWVKPDIPPS